MQYLGLVGKKQSGKDTAFNALQFEYGSKQVVRLAFADELKKEVCTMFNRDLGWLNDNKNHPMIRQLLQTWGVWRRNTEGENYWLNKVSQAISELPPSVKLVVFTDCRFLNEAQFIRDLKGKLVRIVRPSLEVDGVIDTHCSEIEQDKILVDMHIMNDQRQLRLEKQMVDVVKNYFKML